MSGQNSDASYFRPLTGTRRCLRTVVAGCTQTSLSTLKQRWMKCTTVGHRCFYWPSMSCHEHRCPRAPIDDSCFCSLTGTRRRPRTVTTGYTQTTMSTRKQRWRKCTTVGHRCLHRQPCPHAPIDGPVLTIGSLGRCAFSCLKVG